MTLHHKFGGAALLRAEHNQRAEKRRLAQLQVHESIYGMSPDLIEASARAANGIGLAAELPEPHILDFDWRYTPETVSELAELVRPSDAVLAVGAPSVARHLEWLGRDVVLVDRQPFHAVRNHVQIEPVNSNSNFGKRSCAIVDPPWYPVDAKLWIAWTAHRVALRERILVSLWPDSTRPAAASEFENLRSWIAEWADIEALDVVPRYQTPLFETAAVRAAGSQAVALSPGYGRLLCLRARYLPSMFDYRGTRKKWVRFVVNDYQLAICLDENGRGQAPVGQHPRANGFIWPYVSKREPQQDLINLWSSRNEVAILRDPHLAAAALREAFRTADLNAFKEQLGPYAKLLELDIPRPPYRRLLEWQHLQ